MNPIEGVDDDWFDGELNQTALWINEWKGERTIIDEQYNTYTVYPKLSK